MTSAETGKWAMSPRGSVGLVAAKYIKKLQASLRHVKGSM